MKEKTGVTKLHFRYKKAKRSTTLAFRCADMSVVPSARGEMVVMVTLGKGIVK